VDTSLGLLAVNPGGWGQFELVSIVSSMYLAVQRDTILKLHGISQSCVGLMPWQKAPLLSRGGMIHVYVRSAT